MCSKVIAWTRNCGRSRWWRRCTNQYKNMKSPPVHRGDLISRSLCSMVDDSNCLWQLNILRLCLDLWTSCSNVDNCNWYVDVSFRYFIDILRFTYSFIYGTEVAWLHLFLCLSLMSKTSLHNEAAVNLKQFISIGSKKLIIAICVAHIFFVESLQNTTWLLPRNDIWYSALWPKCNVKRQKAMSSLSP